MDTWVSLYRLFLGLILRNAPRHTDGSPEQVLKIMIARIVKSERYVVLDAKNHLVFPLTINFL